MPYKVIVADPSPSTQKAVQAAFPYPVFEVFPCDNGSDLDETALRIRPDALLINLFLSGGDGRSTANRIRSRDEFKNLPVVFLGGTFEAFDIEDDAEAGRIVVRKPFDSEKLALNVRDMIDGALTPPTLPEEPDFDAGLEDKDPLVNTGTFLEAGDVRMEARPLLDMPDIEPRILALIRRETAALEREIEKRVTARILGILKGTSGRKPRDIPRVGGDKADPAGDA